jgi:hypothetical protein
MENIIKPIGHVKIGPSSHPNTNTIIVPFGYTGNVYVPDGLGSGHMYGPSGFTGTEVNSEGNIIYSLAGTTISPTYSHNDLLINNNITYIATSNSNLPNANITYVPANYNNIAFGPSGYNQTIIIPTSTIDYTGNTGTFVTPNPSGSTGTSEFNILDTILDTILDDGSKIVPNDAEDAITFENIVNGDILVNFNRDSNKTEYDFGVFYKESTLKFILKTNKNQFTMKPIDVKSIRKYTAIIE